MRRLDELDLEAPYYGDRNGKQPRREGHKVGRRHARTLM
jgi:hypothetical protein